MNHSLTADDRLTDLEIKASFTEDLLERLDAVIVRQQQQIDSLTREIAHLKQTASSGEKTEFRSLRDGPPPHY
jgi:SlyX protein